MIQGKRKKHPKTAALVWIFLFPISYFLFPISSAWAHRLEAQAFVRPFWTVQVESWFETGDSPKAAGVAVFGPDGKVVAEGKLDDQGIFAFPYEGAGPVRVVVNAGAGHRAELAISSQELAKNAVCTCVACLPNPWVAAPLLVPVKLGSPPTPVPLAEHRGVPILKLALGVGFLLAVAGVALGLRKRRQRRGAA